MTSPADAPKSRRRRKADVAAQELSDVDRQPFMFAVGIECSYPTIDGGRRVDQYEATGHYEHWKKDLSLVRELGLRYLRYGPPLHKVWLGPGKYDWGVSRRRDGRDAAFGHRADHRPAALRPARLDQRRRS